MSSSLCNPMDRSPPGSSVHGILQVRVLKWVACPSLGHLPDLCLLHLLNWQVGSLPLVPPGKPSIQFGTNQMHSIVHHILAPSALLSCSGLVALWAPLWAAGKNLYILFRNQTAPSEPVWSCWKPGPTSHLRNGLWPQLHPMVALSPCPQGREASSKPQVGCSVSTLLHHGACLLSLSPGL